MGEGLGLDREGDRGPLLARSERRLRLLLLHLAGPAVRRRVEMDDLLQEVFLRALTAKALPPAGPELERFLATLARHVVVDAARAARAQKRAGSTQRLSRSDWTAAGPNESALAARSPGPLTRLAEREDEAALADALRSLLPEHRRVLGLRQFEGLSARETSLRMGRSESAVHSLYRRALEAWDEALTRRME